MPSQPVRPLCCVRSPHEIDLSAYRGFLNGASA